MSSDGAAPPWEPHFGGLRLEQSRLLGRGAFGEVFLVKAFPRPGSPGAGGPAGAFALKRSPAAQISEAGLERAKDEARLLQRLGEEHESILRCFDFRVTPGPSAALELLLEFAPLGDLSGRLRAHRDNRGGVGHAAAGGGDPVRGLPEAEVVAFACDVAAGLAHIHALSPKVLHRDIKPANVVLFPVDAQATAEAAAVPRAKIADFGIAKILEADGSFAGAATVIGTPHYFSPEICRGEKYDERSDAWALGCVIYEMICLRRPFHQAEGNIAVLALRVMEGKYDKELLTQTAGRYNGLIIFLLVGLLALEPAQRSRAADLLRPLAKLRGEVPGARACRAAPWWEALPAAEAAAAAPPPTAGGSGAEDEEVTRAPETIEDSWAGAHRVPLGSRPITPAPAAGPEEAAPTVNTGNALEEVLLSKTLFASAKFTRTSELLSYSETVSSPEAACDPPTMLPAATAGAAAGADPATLLPEVAAASPAAAGAELDPPTLLPEWAERPEPAAAAAALGPDVLGAGTAELGGTLRLHQDGSVDLDSPYIEQLERTASFDVTQTQFLPAGPGQAQAQALGQAQGQAAGAPSRLAWMGCTDDLMGLLSEPPSASSPLGNTAASSLLGAGAGPGSLSGSATAFSFGGPGASSSQEAAYAQRGEVPESPCYHAMPEGAEASPPAPGGGAYDQDQTRPPHAHPQPRADPTLRCAGARIFLRPLWASSSSGAGGASDGPVIFCFGPEVRDPAHAHPPAQPQAPHAPPPPQPPRRAESSSADFDEAATATATWGQPQAAAPQERGQHHQQWGRGHHRQHPSQGWLEVELTVENASAINQHLVEQYKRTAGIFSLTAVD